VPLVARGTTAAPAPTAAPTPAPAPAPVAVRPSGPLSVLSGGPSSIGQLSPIQALAPQPLAHHGGLPGYIGAPLNRLLAAASAPVMATGSLIRGHPLEAVRHLAAIPADVASIPIPQLKDLYNRIPGLKEHEFVLPSQALHERGLLPGGTLGSILGFGADVALDPLTYPTLGAGGALAHGAEAGLRAAEEVATRRVAEVVAQRSAAEAAGQAIPAGHFVDYTNALVEANRARDAIRAARAPGARLSVGIPGTRISREVGQIPGTAAVSRVVGKGVAKLRTNEAIDQAIKDFEEHFFAGGALRKDPRYRAEIQTNRVINTYGQKLTRANRALDRELKLTVPKMGRAKVVAPDGKAFTYDSAHEYLFHHIEQPEKYPLPQQMEHLAPIARKLNAAVVPVEHGHGINYDPLPNYMTHVMRSSKGAERFQSFARGRSMSTPYYTKTERFPHLEAIQNARADAQDVLEGRAQNVGDPLNFDPETNVSRALQARINAHVNALQEHAMRLAAAERSGIKPMAPADVEGIDRLRGISEESDAALRELQRPTDLRGYTATVKSRLAQRRSAEFGLRVAQRPAPALAARERAGRLLAERVGTRAQAQVAAREAVKAGEQPAIRETRTALRQARGAAERARRAVVRADRSADPLALRQAQRELEAAQRAHTEARIAHARAQGTYKGTGPAIRIATRKADVARRRLNLALTDQQKVERLRSQLAKLPGREVSPEEWNLSKKVWGPNASAGILEGRGRVIIPKDEQDIIKRVQEDINASMPDPQSRDPIQEFLRKLTGHWKVLALVSPGYHLRNAYGDSISAWWAGARNPISFLQAARIIKNQDNPEKLRAMKIMVGGKLMTGEEFLHEAAGWGIHGQGFIPTEIGRAQPTKAGENISKLRARMPWAKDIKLPGEGRVTQLSGRIGQMREDSTRLGTYLDLRKQGMSQLDAAERTHTFLFDYGHVSRFVAKARRFWMPFITYTSKAVPRTLKMAATRPGYFSHHAELANALSTAAGIEPGGPADLPVGQRSSFGIPDPGGILHHLLGMPADQPILWNPERVSPWGTLNAIDPNQLQRGPAANLLNPFVGAAIQAPTQHRFYYAGSAPRRAVAPPIISALHDLGLPIPDYGPKTSQALGRDVPGYSSSLDEILRLFPPFSFSAGFNPEDPEGLRRAAASYFAGLPLQSYDRAALAARAQRYGG
jgi:hypothetical protein